VSKKTRNVLIPFQNHPLIMTCALFYSHLSEVILHAVVCCPMLSVWFLKPITTGEGPENDCARSHTISGS
jgi:hypothetical protein